MIIDVTLKLRYNKDNLETIHSFNYMGDFKQFTASALAELAQGKRKFTELDKAVDGLVKIIDGLRCSFRLHIYATIVNTNQTVQSIVEFSLVPSKITITRPGAATETQSYDLIKDGREKVKAVLRKEVKKIKGLYKAAALEALVEKAKKAEAK